MPRRPRGVVALLSALLGVASGFTAACTGRVIPEPARTVPVADSLRGVLAIVGNDPLTRIQLATGAGVSWMVVGADEPVLRAASGLEVVLFGRIGAPDVDPPATRQFTAQRMVVRAADGISAQDGILEREGARYVLRLADDRRVALPAIPEALRGRLGARIWWAGPTDRAPSAYGVLRTP
ncbi:MAG: hypothetical protein P3C12_15270 [Gemmatimonadota bacterium]|nr:hypothetical protein [Gemmatimonadota bacterium]